MRKNSDSTSKRIGFLNTTMRWKGIVAILVCSSLSCRAKSSAIDPLELLRVKALVATVAVADAPVTPKPQKVESSPAPVEKRDATNPQADSPAAVESPGAESRAGERKDGVKPGSPASSLPSPQVVPPDSVASVQEVPRPVFSPRMAPASASRKLVVLIAPWCQACPAHKANIEQFRQHRGLSAGEIEYQEFREDDTSGPQRRKRRNVTELPVTILEDANGNEIARRSGVLTFAEIEDLWLSGPKRMHALNGIPIDRTAFALSPEVESILQRLPQLVKQSRFSVQLNQEINIPLPGVGEIVIPSSIATTAGPTASGFAVSVDKGTPAPWVKSKWLGTLYPVPILGVVVSGKAATVQLRGWHDLTISLE